MEHAHLLFPTLPPELRNVVYSHTTSTHASNTGIPFASKTYDICATQLHIYPVHHGNRSLLALQKYGFLEASEYHSHLLSHCVELRIAIVFKARIDCWVQTHWDERVRRSVAKLMKKYAWLKNVRRVEVKVFWQPRDGIWASTKHDGKVAVILNGMLRTLLGGFDSKKMAEVTVALHIAAGFKRLRYALDAFMRVCVLEGREKRTVILARNEETRKEQKTGMMAIKDVLKDERIMSMKDGLVRWGEKAEGDAILGF